MNPLHIAQELTLIDKELLVRISWNELSSCNWMTKHKVFIKLICTRKTNYQAFPLQNVKKPCALQQTILSFVKNSFH
jgi:hypothetical protein